MPSMTWIATSRTFVIAGASFSPRLACAFSVAAVRRFWVLAVESDVRAKSPCASVVCFRIAD
jgi:hypothetical protein